MKNVQTGHTLADQKNPGTLEPMVFPDPVISIAVAPKDKAASEKLGIALGKMIAEDPSFRVETDEESGETILKGMGELHLDIKIDILKRTHSVEVEVGKPRTKSRQVVQANLVKLTTQSPRQSVVLDSNLNQRLRVVTCRVNTGRPLRRASK